MLQIEKCSFSSSNNFELHCIEKQVNVQSVSDDRLQGCVLVDDIAQITYLV